MSRKTCPIPPGITMIASEPAELYLDENLTALYWWNPTFNKNTFVRKVKFASVVSYKTSNNTIENNKGYIKHKWVRAMELEDKRTKGIVYDYHNPSPYGKQTPNITVQQIKNEPIIGVQVIGTSPYLSSKDEVLVLLPGDYLFTMDLASFVEVVARGEIVNGEIKSELIWASTGSRFTLIRKDSLHHESLMRTGDEE